MLDEILEFNREFVKNKGYETYIQISIRKRKPQSSLVWIQD